jgi:hypothetical protein
VAAPFFIKISEGCAGENSKDWAHFLTNTSGDWLG